MMSTSSRVAKASGRTIAPVAPRDAQILPEVARDRRLVDSCLAGDVPAWSALYQQFHDSLLASIRGFLGRARHDANLVEEIAARVWYAVVKNNFELLAKFDARRGCRLSTFLSLISKNEARLLLRSERRRRVREQVASRQETSNELGDSPLALSDEEFVATLSPAERAFYFDVLVPAGPCDGEGQERNGKQVKGHYSQQNLWQLRHRIRKKLERYIAESS